MSLRQELYENLVGLDRFVIVTLIEINGSAPREVGARMIVTGESSQGSIGGGNLEFQAIQNAQAMLVRPQKFTRKTEYSGLGITLKQCCGGAVQLMYEMFAGNSADQLIHELGIEGEGRPRYLVSCVSDDRPTRVVSRRDDVEDLPDSVWDTARELVAGSSEYSRLVSEGSTQWFITHLNEKPIKIVLFGAGHVGKALVPLLQNLPFQIDWVDQREDVFPSSIPDNARTLSPDDLTSFIDSQPDGAFFVVMTHDHGLDYELCLHILKRRNFGWLGLIGSRTKRLRFEQRLNKDGINSFTLQRLICPIGLPSIRGKYPAVIALSTAAQLQEVRNRIAKSEDTERSVLQAEVQT